MLISYNTSKYFFIRTFNCSTILWVSVSQGQLLGNMSHTEVCGSLTKTVKPSFILGSSQWPIQTLGGGGDGWSSRPWNKGLGSGLKKNILALLASVWSKNRGAAPLDLSLPLWNERLCYKHSRDLKGVKTQTILPVQCGYYPESLWNSAMSSKTELPRWKDLTLVSNVNKAVLSWSLFWPSQWTMNSMNF